MIKIRDFFFRSSREKSQSIDVSSLMSVHELDRFGGLLSAQKVKLRHDVGILVVDNEDAEEIRVALERYQYSNIRTVTERPSDEIVEKYPIIITDVCGIGEDLNSNGLQFAEHIKETFPLKQVIVVSGRMQKAEYKNDIEITRRLEGVFKKGTSYDKLAAILDPCVSRVYEPALVWREIRRELLSVRGAEKKDTEIGKVAVWEDQFVRQFLKISNNQDSPSLDWVSLMTKTVGMATQVVGLLSGIKALVVG